jgi:hypothetical protein
MAEEVILREPGDLLRFATPEEAARYMEPVDVRHGEWTAWDATGRVLEPAVEEVRRGRGVFSVAVEQVVLHATEAQDPGGLTDAIHEWLLKRGLDAPPPANVEEALSAWRRLG